MEFVETEGDSVDEAIEKALKILGVERDKVEVEVLVEGRVGILGFGAKKACIRASLRKPIVEAAGRGDGESSVVGEKGREVLREILRLMGVEGTVEAKAGEAPEEILLEIRSGEGGLLIGHRGQTLEALQYLVTRIVSERRFGEGVQLVVDTESYRERRRRSLEDMALRLGEKAKRERKTVSVDALSAADRRIIHAVLQDDPWLTTKSLGTGPYRRLLIIPEGDRKKKEPPKGDGPKSP
ncbi:MAG: Jag N-terminal domain-containing protein [Deltaproteobacteria bacterium]|nr:Jag N-terminal domain-containing protein [Deltaproteobacteria bacterium]